MANFEKTRVKQGSVIDLNKIDPSDTFGWDKDDAKKQTQKNLARIAELQDLMFHEGKHALLLLMQGSDTAGKDGVVKTVGGAMNPAGVTVTSFKAPTKEELSHGFMWRIENAAPKKPGFVGIFNRSQYEDVGIVRVHNLVPEKEWRPRFDIIRDWEHKISQPSPEIPGGTHVLKFFLLIDKDEQWERLMDRVNTPDKHYKVNEGDFKERAYWDQYMEAYSEAISKTSTDEAPWFVIPANKKWMRDLVISQIVVDHLESLNMKYPPPEVDIDKLRETYFPDGKHEKTAAPPEQKKAAGNSKAGAGFNPKVK